MILNSVANMEWSSVIPSTIRIAHIHVYIFVYIYEYYLYITRDICIYIYQNAQIHKYIFRLDIAHIVHNG